MLKQEAMSKAELAASYFQEGFTCSQSVFSAYAPSLGLNRETALRISAAFGGGICRMGEVCGALCAALMLIGLKHGKTKAEDVESAELTSSAANKFISEFKESNGSIMCKELLGCDISTPQGWKLAEEKGIFSDSCPRFIQSSIDILEQIL